MFRWVAIPFGAGADYSLRFAAALDLELIIERVFSSFL